MADQKHKPKWQVLEKQRSHTRETERIICGNLRAPRLLGVSLRTQAPVGAYVVDFVCAAKSILEGDRGHHFEPKTIVRDARQDAYLAAQGVARFNNLKLVKHTAGVLVPQTSCLALLGSRGSGGGHAGREDVP